MYPAKFETDAGLTHDHLIACNSHHLVGRVVTVLSGEVAARGSVIGKVTASGKYVLSLSASSDGSEVPDAVLAEDVDATAGDIDAIAYFRGDFTEDALTIGTGHTLAGIREGLRVKGIVLVASDPANV